jgi:hypothetical protein
VFSSLNLKARRALVKGDLLNIAVISLAKSSQLFHHHSYFQMQRNRYIKALKEPQSSFQVS